MSQWRFNMQKRHKLASFELAFAFYVKFEYLIKYTHRSDWLIVFVGR